MFTVPSACGPLGCGPGRSERRRAIASDPLKLYLKDIKNIPLLTAQEELKLARRVKKGDAAARKLMIQSNLRLVISIAKRYGNLGVPLSDLVEEGNLGLMRAVQKFNPSKGYRFSTYAAWWIKQFVLRAIANQGKTIRIPVYMVDIISRYRKAIERLTQRLGRKPEIQEIARLMKLSVRKVESLEELTTPPASLDAPVGEEGTAQFIDLIENAGATSSKDELAGFLVHEKVADLLDHLSDRERAILTLRYGLQDGVTYTLGETAKQLNLTRERVRQIQSSVERKLNLYLQAQEAFVKEGSSEARRSLS
ncbi:MAG: sigma-70 family RNA polymerase sigma factor [Candidatus Omnitrophica bacterium]|nr:sigma-70 family RNA polymerase sigma factor [Candidatus Omnitrophota bacterium]